MEDEVLSTPRRVLVGNEFAPWSCAQWFFSFLVRQQNGPKIFVDLQTDIWKTTETTVVFFLLLFLITKLIACSLKKKKHYYRNAQYRKLKFSIIPTSRENQLLPNITLFFFLYIAVYVSEDVALSYNTFFSKVLSRASWLKAKHLQHKLNKDWFVCLPVLFQAWVRMDGLPLENIHLVQRQIKLWIHARFLCYHNHLWI